MSITVRIPLRAAKATALVLLAGVAFRATPALASAPAPMQDRSAGVSAANVRSALDAAGSTSSTISTIPYWQFNQTVGGTTYTEYMAGHVFTSGTSLSIADSVLPVKLYFKATGKTLDPASIVSSLLASPLFHSAAFKTGTTQYGDAMYRGEFFKRMAGGWHNVLAQPALLPELTLTVPAADGTTFQNSAGGTTGRVLESWFESQIQAYVTSHGISPSRLVIVQTYNAELYMGTDPKCSAGCAIGLHFGFADSTATRIWTVSWASWTTAGAGYTHGQLDVEPQSHEIAEWYSDPFGDNVTPTWSSPVNPLYGCQNYFEVGDPVAGVNLPLTNGYHLQDEVFSSWFFKQSPSVGYGGLYDYSGALSSPSPTCTL